MMKALPQATLPSSASSIICRLACCCLLVAGVVSQPVFARPSPNMAEALQLPPAADSKANLQNRLTFIKAEKQLMSGEIRAYRKLRKTLDGYVLAPFLDYLYLRQGIAGNFGLKVSDAEAQAFMAKYPDNASNPIMRRALLRRHAAKQQWQALIAEWQPTSDSALRCNWVQARILRQPKDPGLINDALALWLVGKDQVKDCDPVFAWLEKNNQLTSKRRWQRIRMLLDNGRLSLAAYIAKDLSKADQAEFKAWEQLYRDPEAQLHTAVRQQEHWTAEQVAFGLRRLVRKDVELATELWTEIRKYFALDTATQAELARAIALRKAWRRQDGALKALESLPAAAQDTKVREWLLRTAIYQSDWPALLRSYALLPPAEQQQEDWRYWQAKALLASGERREAKKILMSLTKDRNYYGYLAADLLDRRYQLQHKAIVAKPKLQQQLLGNIHLLRARELYAVDQQILAHREWERAFKTLSAEQQTQAAIMAEDWGWHFQSLRGLAKAGEFNDLERRYPTPWIPIVKQNSNKQALDEAWVLGLMRSESLFRDSARSPVGALGLMQIMPATGKAVAKRQAVKLGSSQDLLNPNTNIHLGTAYMREMLDRFEQNLVLATAAYNAGPTRINRYRPEQQAVAADAWIDTLPVTETRGYVKRVLEHTTVYDWRLTGKTERLKQRMPAIPAKNPPSAEDPST